MRTIAQDELSKFIDPNTIRFAVGTSDGPQSAWWFIKFENKGDVYVSVRGLGGHLKLSLHRPHEDENLNRYCQLGFPKDRLKMMREAGLEPPEKHFFFRWQRPQTPETGFRRVLSITIPTEFLNRNPPPINDADIKYLFSPPRSGYALEFSLLYSIEDASSLEESLENICTPMINNKVNTGETISFVHRAVPFNAAKFLSSKWGTPLPFSDEIEKLPPGASLEGLSMIKTNDPKVEGYIRLWDVSNVTLSKGTGGSTDPT